MSGIEQILGGLFVGDVDEKLAWVTERLEEWRSSEKGEAARRYLRDAYVAALKERWSEEMVPFLLVMDIAVPLTEDATGGALWNVTDSGDDRDKVLIRQTWEVMNAIHEDVIAKARDNGVEWIDEKRKQFEREYDQAEQNDNGEQTDSALSL